MPFIHSTPYRISDAENRCCQMNGQPIVNPSRTTRMSTKVNGGAAVGMNGSSNLVNVDLPRNYTDDNSNAIGGDVGPVVYELIGPASQPTIVTSTHPLYPGFAAFGAHDFPIDVGDVVQFGGTGTTDYRGVYRVIATTGNLHCVLNVPYVSGTGTVDLIYRNSGTIDTQSNRYTMVGSNGNEMERNRVHQVQKMVMGNEPSIVRSGLFLFNSGTYTVPVTYTDRWPTFKVSGTGSHDATVVNYGLSVGGGYAIKLGKGVRNMKRGRHLGKNE